MDYSQTARAIIRAEAYALDMLAAMTDDAFDNAMHWLLDITGKVIVTGMGKSGLVARKIAATMQSTGTKAVFLHPADAAHGDMGIIAKRDAILALSNSGETDELRPVFDFAEANKLLVILITGHPQSSLAQRAACKLLIPNVPEACPIGLAPTSSTAAMMALGDAIAGVLMKARGFGAQDFYAVHHGGYLGSRLRDVA